MKWRIYNQVWCKTSFRTTEQGCSKKNIVINQGLTNSLSPNGGTLEAETLTGCSNPVVNPKSKTFVKLHDWSRSYGNVKGGDRGSELTEGVCYQRCWLCHIFKVWHMLKKEEVLLQNWYWQKKSRIRETQTLSTDADRRTDTNFKRLHDLFKKKIFKKK